MRVGSMDFVDFYIKVGLQITGLKRMCLPLQTRSKPLWQCSFIYLNAAPFGILDYPMQFIFWLVLIVVASIYFNDCQAEPMLPIYLIIIGKCYYTSFNLYYYTFLLCFLFYYVGVIGSSIQIVEQILGSLMKDSESITWKIVKDIYDFSIMCSFAFVWFFLGKICDI